MSCFSALPNTPSTAFQQLIETWPQRASLVAAIVAGVMLCIQVFPFATAIA